MMKLLYRLGQYKIIENENGNLWWECYSHFATTNSGKCFVVGNILFLGPYSKISEPGYLLLEYNELLNKLPQWEKTKYYCSTYTIQPCKTGRIPPGNAISSRAHEVAKRGTHNVTTEVTGTGRGKTEQSDEANSISCRLAQYEIIENESAELCWKAHAGLGRVRHGKCFIEEGILFIAASSNADLKKPGESGFLRREFLKHLNQLPKWDKTEYYCSSYTLRLCKTGRIPLKRETSSRSRERTKRFTNSVTTEVSGSRGLKPKRSDEIYTKFKRSGERTGNTIRQFTSQIFSAVISFRQLPKGDTHVKFKKYINRTQKCMFSTGTRLLVLYTGFLSVLSGRGKRRENGSYQDSHEEKFENYERSYQVLGKSVIQAQAGKNGSKEDV